MLYTTYYVKARMTRNLKSLANLPVNPLTCQLVYEFRQRVIIENKYSRIRYIPKQASEGGSLHSLVCLHGGRRWESSFANLLANALHAAAHLFVNFNKHIFGLVSFYFVFNTLVLAHGIFL